jgi:glycosyltransferase involved in cell wall biosynthesis
VNDPDGRLSTGPGIKLCRVTTVAQSLWSLMRGQLEFMQGQGFNVLAVSSPSPLLERITRERSIATRAVDMTRTITPMKDLGSARALACLFAHEQPAIVHSHTPKAGLLAMAAAARSRVRIRIHTFAGTSAGGLGLRNTLWRLGDYLTALCATHVLAISPSLAVDLGRRLPRGRPLTVLGAGSSNGVDTGYFSRTETSCEAAAALRRELGIPADRFVLAYVGRLVSDKGIGVLLDSLRTMRAVSDSDSPYLLIVGSDQGEWNLLPDRVTSLLSSDQRIRLLGFQDDVRPAILASDVLVLPSFREGFGNVLIEAQSLGVPVVGSRITGIVDAVDDGQTGLLVDVGDARALRLALQSLMDDPGRRMGMGKRGAQWVRERFSQTRIWSALHDFYRQTLHPIASGDGA